MEECNKYQTLFVFRDEAELEAHLVVCETCRKKHAQMQKLDSLLKSAKPIYYKKKYQHNNIGYKIAVSLALIIFSSLYYINTGMIQLHPQNVEVSQLINNSIFNQMKLPTDSYGLIDLQGDVYHD